MTVQMVIDRLMSIEDKSKEIVFEDNFVNIDYLEYDTVVELNILEDHPWR